MHALWKLAPRHRVALVSAMWLSLASAMSALALARVLADALDAALRGTLVGSTLAALAALGLARAALGVVQGLVAVGLGHRVATELRAALVEHTLRSGAEERWSPSEITTRVTHDVTTAQALVAFRAPTFVGDGLAAVALIAYAVSLDAVILAVAAAPVLLVSPLAVVVARRAAARADVAREGFGRVVEVVGEAVEATRIIRHHDASAAVAERTSSVLEAFERAAMRARVWAGGSAPLLQIAALASAVSVIAAIATRVASGALETQAALAALAALSLAARPVLRIASTTADLAPIASSLARIDELAATGGASIDVLPRPDGFERLVIRSEALARGGREILRDVELHIARGERIAIVGPNGAGKSTLLDAIAGVSEAARSLEIEVDGRASSARALVSWMPQRPVLLEGDVAENVALGANGLEIARVEAVLAEVGLALTDRGGARARVEPGGRNFSIGERQRLCLARALYRGRPLLVLDEPTASLDAQSARAFVLRLRGALADGEQTVVLATHDEALIAVCERVLEIDDGRLTPRRARSPAAPVIPSA